MANAVSRTKSHSSLISFIAVPLIFLRFLRLLLFVHSSRSWFGPECYVSAVRTVPFPVRRRRSLSDRRSFTVLLVIF
jgi:hypothetical protein